MLIPMEDQHMRIVEEELELAKRRIDARMKSCSKDGSTMKLEFRNGIARMILTGEEIKGEGDVPIEVALVDGVTGDVVVDEPEASAKVEFYLINVCGAEESIVPQGEGKLPILAGNAPLHLHRGVANVNGLKIRNYATKIKPPVFKLGVGAAGAYRHRIKEAKTEAFALKDFRIKYFKKHKNPSLSDQVSRLVFIRRGGKINERLQDNHIKTVEDFLIRLLIDPQSLKRIVKTQAKKWKAIVNNAQACLVSERVYCYIDPNQKTGVVFNILGRVQGLCSGSHYSQTSTLSEKHKVDAEKLLASAYQNWNEVKAFDDQNSLQQHLDDLTEMVGESASAMSSCGEDVVGSMDDEIDVVYDAAMQSPHDWPWSPSFFEGLRSESNGDEPRMVVGSGNSPRMWRKVVCVSKWLSLRRRVALLHLTPAPEEQRIV